MRNPHGNYWIPDEGYKYITNGEVFTDSIYLGARDSIANWRDATAEEYEAWQRQDDPSEVATAEDYEAALKELGVKL